MMSRIRSWWMERRVRRMVRRSVAAMNQLQAEEEEELERDRGKWRCEWCSWIGEAPVSGSETWELENIRGFSPKRLDRIADCPACGRHSAYLVGDPGRPIPKDFPLPGFESQGPCPKCASEDTVPIVRGYPSKEAMLASSMGKAKLGGCIIIHDEDGTGPAYRCCKACGCEW